MKNTPLGELFMGESFNERYTENQINIYSSGIFPKTRQGS